MSVERVRIPGRSARRWIFFTLVGATTLGGVAMMVRVVGAHGFTLLEALILGLFAPTFGWIVLPFWTALAGFVLKVARRHPLTLAPVGATGVAAGPTARPAGLTAVVVPVYDEDATAVAARVSAIARSLRRTGAEDRFHVHLLSDTRDPSIARREEAEWLGLQAENPDLPIHYRRREWNEGRKAGNIAEFCRRCVDDYDYMVVLDADSLMTGPTLVALARALDANPEVGLVQTVPLPVRARTLFGRCLQLAARLYSPVLATGQSFWQADAANYWGHNAIVRLRAFAQHARLPRLPGDAPLGGEILSHDFVEAALLRRAGWKVLLEPTLEGSWEEVPGTLEDYARRDRRWAQGSLQHLRLLAEPGLHPLSRLHFVLGAMGYVSSLLWLLILLAGTAYVLLPGLQGPTLAAPTLPPPIAFSLLAVTAVLLFLPKALGVVLALGERARFGGASRLLGSAVAETVFSVLLAPVMMLYHARFVVAILLGRSVEWNPHLRDGSSSSWRDAWRIAALPMLVGLLWGGATLALSPLFFMWMSPIFAGLLLSVPLARLGASDHAGGAAEARGVLLVPEETAPPPEVAHVRSTLAAIGTEPAPDGFEGLAIRDPRRAIGVHPGPGGAASGPLPTRGRSMHHAERGLFDLRQGRPFLVTETASRNGSDARGAVLVATVEGLDQATWARLREMSSETPRLLLTEHRVAAMGLGTPAANGRSGRHFALALEPHLDVAAIVELSCGPARALLGRTRKVEGATPAESAALSLVRLGRLLPAVVALPVPAPPNRALREALETGALLRADADEVQEFVDSSGAEIVRIGEAPVPLAEAEESRFVLFREAHGLQEHVAILVGRESDWPDPVPVRLHSACLTGDLFGSLRCDCGEQLRSSMELFASRGGGVLLYLAQEGRGIGLRNKFRAYTLQEGGLDTIEADGALGFGPDERRYDVAVRILETLGVKRIELLTNNPEKVRAMQEAGIVVVRRMPLHGTLNRHNLPYVRAKVQRAGHWLGDMLSQPLSGD